MIKEKGGGWALEGVVIDTTVVVEPWLGVDGDGEWSEDDSLLEGDLSLGDGGSSGDVGGPLELGGLALTVLGLVRILGFGDGSVLDVVVEGVLLETTVASLVTERGGAIDELGLGEGDEGLEVGEVLGLEGTGRGEGPAGSALSLVLDWGDVSLGSPVDGEWVGVGGLWLDSLVFWDDVSSSAEVLDGELFLGHGGEVGESELVALVELVLGLDVSEVLDEDGESVELLLWACEGLVELSGPVLEGDELFWSPGLVSVVLDDEGGHDAEAQGGD